MQTSHRRTTTLAGLGTIAVACVLVAIFRSNDFGSPSAEADEDPMTMAVSTTTVADPVDSSATNPGSADSGTLPGPGDLDPVTPTQCTIRARSLRVGDSGDDVLCLQRSLIEASYLTGAPSGVYDNATVGAVKKLQTERNLFIDGLTGRETALSLGIWPEEISLVVRTPKPAPGAVDLWGYPLSSVATSGPDAPPLPPDSGSGRRLVYQRAGQRVWAVDENEVVIRSWLVSGSKYDNELPGIHRVYSRSESSVAGDGESYFNLMVRWLKTSDDAIGFHALPIKVADNSLYQTEAELGQRLSVGCQRQANLDAEFTWEFAQVGTPVVVV